MKNVLMLFLSILLFATLSNAKSFDWTTPPTKEELAKAEDIEWVTVNFNSRYEANENVTEKDREDRAYKGYCVNSLYFPNDFGDVKDRDAGKEIVLFTKGALPLDTDWKAIDKFIKIACKKALDKNPENFKGELLRRIKEATL